MYEKVLNQLRDAGLILDSFEADTASIVRCKVEGETGSKKSGWYRVFSVISKAGNTYYVGSFGNWKNGALPEKGKAIEYEHSGLTKEDKQAIKLKQQQAQRDATKERKQKQADAAKRAVEIWGKLPDVGRSEYLERKKVKGYGVRFSRGSIALPVKDSADAFVGLQFINAEGVKYFLTGTAKNGAFHLIGNVPPASTWIIVAEGYATAASIHEALNLPVVVAFDAGNLKPVALAISKKYPNAKILIAADNDKKGIECANKAVNAVGGIVCIPDFKSVADGDNPEVKTHSDFNDLQALVSLEEVAKQISEAMSDPQPAATQEPQKATAPATVKGYQNLQSGLFWVDPNGDEDSKYRVCSWLSVTARARTSDKREYGLILNFRNFDGDLVEWFIPSRLFAAEYGSKILEGLLDRGLELDPHRNSKKRLLEYLQLAKPTTNVFLSSKLGWFKGAFVTPTGVIGQPEEPVHYYADRKLLNRAGQKGSLEGWKENVSSFCVNNPLMLFSVSMPFVGPILDWVGHRTLGFHLVGPSSLGKSTLAAVAGSVCGGLDYYRTWNTTASALEPTASEHSDSLLILDEINQCDPYTVGKTVYQLGNEEGKARATDTGTGTRDQKSWRTVWLSNGERTLKEIQAGVGKSTEAGQEMRLLHIRADLHKKSDERARKGIYQDLHNFAHGAALSEHVKREIAKNHGHAFPEFVKKLVALSDRERKSLAASLLRKADAFAHANLTDSASGQARRAATCFALVAHCGELATLFGITGWPKGAALEAATMLFKNFISDRGGEGNAEDRAILEAIALTLQTKGESHFTRWDKDGATVDTHQPRSLTRFGFRKVEESNPYTPANEMQPYANTSSTSEECFYIFKEAFRKEICKDFSYKRACQLLLERGALKTHKGKGFLYQATIPGVGSGPIQLYFIKMSALAKALEDGSENAVTEREAA